MIQLIPTYAAISLVSAALLISGTLNAETQAESVQDHGNVYFFSMGHKKMPVFPGSVRITQNSLYRRDIGYGWIHEGTRGERSENLVARTARPNSSPTPDDLSGNRVFWRGGRKPLIFRVNVPDGKYRIWVYSGIFDFDRFIDMAPFEIAAGGPSKNNHDAIKNFKTRFFREFNDAYEYMPDWTVDTIWEKYVRDQSITIYELDGVAENGNLNIEFHKKSSSSTILSINAIVICPLDKLAQGKKLVAGIEEGRRRQFTAKAKLIPAEHRGTLPKAAETFQKAGMVPYVRNFMKRVDPESIPLENEIGQPLNMFMAQGQREILSFAFYPLKDRKDVTLEVSELRNDDGKIFDEKAVKLQWMRYMVQPLDYMRRNYELRGVPVLMMDQKPLNYTRGMNRQYILALTASPETAPGIYRGQIKVSAEGKPLLSMPLQVEVYPFKLESYADDDERVWLYYADTTYRQYGNLLFSESERWKRIDKDLAFMRNQLIAPTILFDYKASEDEIEHFMELYTKYHFRGYGVFGDYSILRMVEYYCTGRSKNKNITPFITKIRMVMDRGKEKNWPQLSFYTFAEMKSGLPGYKMAQEILAQLKREIPGVVLVTLPNSIREAEAMIESQADIIGPNAVSMTETISRKVHNSNKKLWFYGWGRQRFRCGLIDWRLGNRGGIKEWYSYTSGTPFNPLDGICFDSWNDAPPFIGPDGPVSTLGMEETTQGRLDFFYIATLEKWMERASRHKSPHTAGALKQAQALIDDLKARIVPDYSYYYKRMKNTIFKTKRFDTSMEEVFKWKDDEFQTYRRKIADAIVSLKKAVAGIGTAATEAETSTVSHPGLSHSAAAVFCRQSNGALLVSSDRYPDASPSWSPDGNSISFISRREDGFRIVLADLSNRKITVLPIQVSPETCCSWAPGADRIAFTAEDDTVKVLSLRDNQLLSPGKGENPVFSPDGKKIAYTSSHGVVIYDFDTGSAAEIGRSTEELEASGRLCWSHDGKWIYYSGNGDIRVISVTEKLSRRLLNRNSTGLSIGPALENPVVSPDGKKLYLTLNYDGLFAHVSNNQLAVYDLASKKLVQLCDANSWSLSPDGKRIVYGIGDQLMNYEIASGRRTVLFKGTDPVISPQGGQVAYLYRPSLLEEPDVGISRLP